LPYNGIAIAVFRRSPDKVGRPRIIRFECGTRLRLRRFDNAVAPYSPSAVVAAKINHRSNLERIPTPRGKLRGRDGEPMPDIIMSMYT